MGHPMAIESSFQRDTGVLTLRIAGRFDFSTHMQFRAAYDKPDLHPRRVVVDLGAAEYLDSAALGMLLILREHATQQGAAVALRSPVPVVARILEVANFGKLFSIE